VPTGIPEEIGFEEVNSHRTACENRADMTHLILVLVPFETVVWEKRSEKSQVYSKNVGQRRGGENTAPKVIHLADFVLRHYA